MGKLLVSGFALSLLLGAGAAMAEQATGTGSRWTRASWART